MEFPFQIIVYFIEFNDELFQCEIVAKDNNLFTFIHRKTSKLKYPEHDLVYSTQFSARPNFRRKITRPTNEIEKKIAEFYIKDKVFYSDNEVGEIVRNYLIWCGKNTI